MKNLRRSARTLLTLAALALGLTACTWVKDTTGFDMDKLNPLSQHQSQGGGSPAGTASATSYIAVESNTGRILYSSNANAKRPIGMLSHVATAVVVIDWMQSRGVSSSTLITVPAAAAQCGSTNLLKLQEGDRLSIRDALFSALLWEDSAAALTLAEACGSTLNSNNGIGAFTAQMNQMANRLRMSHTSFKGPHGAVVSYSSARDLALLSMYAAQHPQLTMITASKAANVTVHNASGGTRRVAVTNTNRMLGTSSQVEGLKAARSASAGSCLMIAARRSSVKLAPPTGGKANTYAQNMVIVVLGMDAEQRYSAANSFLSKGWGVWEEWQRTGDTSNPSEFVTLP